MIKSTDDQQLKLGFALNHFESRPVVAFPEECCHGNAQDVLAVPGFDGGTQVEAVAEFQSWSVQIQNGVDALLFDAEG